MKNLNNLKPIIIGLALIIIGCQPKAASESTSASIVIPEVSKNPYLGQWESVKAEDLGNGTFGTRYFEIAKENWEVKFTLYLDSTLTMPVFQFRGIGKYEVQGQSTIIEGAENAIFGFDQKFVTLLTDNQDLINNFGFNTCNLEKDTEKDITADGCSFLVSKSICAQEYDLLKVDEGMLYLGMRPAEGDMCTEENRPTALFYPLASILD